MAPIKLLFGYINSYDDPLLTYLNHFSAFRKTVQSINSFLTGDSDTQQEDHPPQSLQPNEVAMHNRYD